MFEGGILKDDGVSLRERKKEMMVDGGILKEDVVSLRERRKYERV